MKNVIRYFTAAVILLMTGCYQAPIRHLASDASLIKAGNSRQDVLLLLGEPDTQQNLADGSEEWIYYEERLSTMQKMPLVGEAFSADGYGLIRIILNDGVVSSCEYSSFRKDELGWEDDYSWQQEAGQ